MWEASNTLRRSGPSEARDIEHFPLGGPEAQRSGRAGRTPQAPPHIMQTPIAIMFIPYQNKSITDANAKQTDLSYHT